MENRRSCVEAVMDMNPSYSSMFSQLVQNKRILATGAEAIVYEATMFGKPIVIKERVEKTYRLPVLDEKLRRQRTKLEESILRTARDHAIPAPRLYFATSYALYLERLQGRTMHEHPSSTWSSFLPAAAKCLQQLHRVGIAHGDYTPANIFITEDETVFVIDFGLSHYTHLEEHFATDLLLMKKSVGKDFDVFLTAYVEGYPDASRHLARMEDIERRGRYVQRGEKGDLDD